MSDAFPDDGNLFPGIDMKVVNASIVRGTAQPGVEVTFAGEGSDSVAVQLRSDSLAAMNDTEVYLRAKQVLAQIVAFQGGNKPT